MGHKRLKVNFTTTFTVDEAAEVMAAFGSTQAFFAEMKLFGNQLFTDFVAEGDALMLPKFAYLQEKLTVLVPDLYVAFNVPEASPLKAVNNRGVTAPDFATTN